MNGYYRVRLIRGHWFIICYDDKLQCVGDIGPFANIGDAHDAAPVDRADADKCDTLPKGEF
jgi:hypothetical protein